MSIRFPLRNPRAPHETCTTEDEFLQRLAAYSARLLYEIHQLAQGSTHAEERFKLDADSLEQLRGAESALLLSLDSARIVSRALEREGDQGFQRFMAAAAGVPARRSTRRRDHGKA